MSDPRILNKKEWAALVVEGSWSAAEKLAAERRALLERIAELERVHRILLEAAVCRRDKDCRPAEGLHSAPCRDEQRGLVEALAVSLSVPLGPGKSGESEGTGENDAEARKPAAGDS